MLSIAEQLETGKLVCPVTHQALSIQAEQLRTADSEISYPMVNGVPILLADKNRQREYLASQGASMTQEYAQLGKGSLLRRFLARLAGLGGDHRSRQSREALQGILDQQQSGALCVAVGGGPRRIHPALVNLNIGLFLKVDIVADAYALPYAEGSVDVTVCSAVLEHLEYPDRAVSEMFRVLKPGGRAVGITPFLQAFHAYPDHYQNFTLIGHRRLFERAGFEVLSAGVCVGPTFVYCDLLAKFVSLLPPRFLMMQIAKVVRLLCVPIRPLDRLLNRNPDVHVMASTTYVLAAKPA